MADERVPEFVRTFIREQLKEVKRGMRIKFVVELEDVVNLIMDQIVLDEGR